MWLDFIAKPMGMFLNFIYNTMAFENYGLSIIIFTLFIKMVLLPLTIKQYKSTARMQEVQPMIQEIQKRYKNDKEKLNQEMMKVYQEHKVNPAGGCFPVLLQMPILFSLYYVISKPLYYMVGKTPEVITKLFEAIPGDFPKIMGNQDITIINYFKTHSDKLTAVADLLKPEELLNMNFLGLNLGIQPTFDSGKIAILGAQFFGLLLIPILAGLTTFLSTKISMAATQQNTENQTANSMTNSMTMIMPFMTAFFAFNVPAGLGLYWITSNILQVLQQLYLNKYIIKKKEAVKK